MNDSRDDGVYNPIKNIQATLANYSASLIKAYGESEGAAKADKLFNPEESQNKFIQYILEERVTHDSYMPSEKSIILFDVLKGNSTLLVKLETIREYTAEPENKGKNLYLSIERAEQKWNAMMMASLKEASRQMAEKNGKTHNGFFVNDRGVYDPVANIENLIAKKTGDVEGKFGKEAVTVLSGVNFMDREWYLNQFIAFILIDRSHNLSFVSSNDSKMLMEALKSKSNLDEKLQLVRGYTANSGNVNKKMYKSIQHAEKMLQNMLAPDEVKRLSVR
jgi:hypothetical protein